MQKNKTDLCRCGHERAFHDITDSGECIHGLILNSTNGIINKNKCNCKCFKNKGKVIFEKPNVVNFARTKIGLIPIEDLDQPEIMRFAKLYEQTLMENYAKRKLNKMSKDKE